jgi:hypothetical protein
MLPTKRAFFSFSEVTDPTRHREYNAWHQLDHLPENLALPSIYHGERFVCSPDCAEARLAAEPPFENLHYVTYYLFREPSEPYRGGPFGSGARTVHLGRGTDFPYVKRHLTGPFVLVKAYANPRVLVEPEVLPFRPTRGLFVHLWELPDLRSPEGQDLLAWYDRVHIPDLLTCKGVAGAWTFTADPAFAPPAASMTWSRGRRVHLYFLDGDPLEFVSDMRSRVPGWRAAGRWHDNTRSMCKDLYLGPLRAIIPWQWDWFE